MREIVSSSCVQDCICCVYPGCGSDACTEAFGPDRLQQVLRRSTGACNHEMTLDCLKAVAKALKSACVVLQANARAEAPCPKTWLACRLVSETAACRANSESSCGVTGSEA